jgi:phosphatidylglycerol:prolipoprotein diacylglycerol transferase
MVLNVLLFKLDQMLLNYINWDVNPEIIKIFGEISLRYYSLLFVSGLLLGYAVVKQIYIREKLPIADLEKLSIYIFIGTIVGARLGHCIFYDPTYYFSHPLEMLLPFQGTIGEDFHFTGYQGLASHGGALGVLLSIIIYSKRSNTDLWFILDKVSVAVPLTGAFIRLGNLMNSEIIGHATNVPWAFVFERVDSLPRHPTQLYEALAYLLIFLIMLNLYNKQYPKKQRGFFFGVFLILLFSSRVLIEFFKMSQEPFENNLLFNMGQLLSIPFIIAGILIVIKKRNKKKIDC